MKLPYSIERQVPEFVRENHPAFIEFIKAYYTWYENEYSIGKLDALLDIDNTVDDFVQYFRKQLDAVSVLNKIDNRLYLKHIKELYASKGSEAAYKFFFRILFDKQSDVVIPWESVFKASGGTWKQQTSVLIDFSANVSYDPTTLINDSIYIVDEYYMKYSVFVDNVVKRTDSIYELYIDRFAPRSFVLTNIQTRDGLVTGTTITSTSGYKVIQSGTNFQIGEVHHINSGPGTGTIIKIKSTTTDGAITAVEFVEFGLGYTDDFTAEISPLNETGTNATLLFKLGHLLKYSGYYTSSDSIVGDAAYIQDSYYYQIYSYVTALEETLDTYGTVLKKILHPAGTKHFATYQINNILSPTLSVTPSLNIISRADAFRDFIQTTESTTTVVGKYLADTGTTSDALSRTVDYVRGADPEQLGQTPDIEHDWPGLSETASTSENRTVVVNKALSTTATAEESFDRVVDYTRSRSDLVTTTDALSIVANQARAAADTVVTNDSGISFVLKTTNLNITNESVTVSTSGAVYGDPIYVDILESAYWVPGYLDTERTITN